MSREPHRPNGTRRIAGREPKGAGPKRAAPKRDARAMRLSASNSIRLRGAETVRPRERELVATNKALAALQVVLETVSSEDLLARLLRPRSRRAAQPNVWLLRNLNPPEQPAGGLGDGDTSDQDGGAPASAVGAVVNAVSQGISTPAGQVTGTTPGVSFGKSNAGSSMAGAKMSSGAGAPQSLQAPAPQKMPSDNSGPSLGLGFLIPRGGNGDFWDPVVLVGRPQGGFLGTNPWAEPEGQDGPGRAKPLGGGGDFL